MAIEVVSLTPMEILAFVMTSFGGLLINFLNKAATEKLSWKDYWSSKPINTVASLMVTSGLFITLAMSGETNHLTYISTSFMADALINRSYQGGYEEKKEELKKERETEKAWAKKEKKERGNEES